MSPTASPYNPFVGRKVGITMEVNGLPVVLGWFDRYDKVVIKKLNDVIEYSCRNIENNARQRAPEDSGNLKRKIGTRPLWGYTKDTPAPDYAVGRIVRSTANYGVEVEFGSGPLGAATYGGRLPDWFRHKGSYGMPYSFGKYQRRHKEKVEISPSKTGKRRFRSVYVTAGGVRYTPLSRWAIKHGLNPWWVAKKVKMRGGNPARPFLGPAFEDERPMIIRRIQSVLNTSGPAARSPGGASA